MQVCGVTGADVAGAGAGERWYPGRRESAAQVVGGTRDARLPGAVADVAVVDRSLREAAEGDPLWVRRLRWERSRRLLRSVKCALRPHLSPAAQPVCARIVRLPVHQDPPESIALGAGWRTSDARRPAGTPRCSQQRGNSQAAGTRPPPTRLFPSLPWPATPGTATVPTPCWAPHTGGAVDADPSRI